MAIAQPVTRENGSGLVGRRHECEVLDGLVEAVDHGQSQTLVLCGEPGVGKSVLLDYVANKASDCRLVRAAGVQSEMELAFAALHQLCAPMLSDLVRLPAPQAEALRTAFGIGAGLPPDRFLVALAVLTLFSEAAEARPLICLVDDEQWVDRASTQVLAFVARRLDAESVALIFASRTVSEELASVTQLVVEGLPEAASRELLDAVLTAPLDCRVRDQIVAETRGNPLALLELVRGMSPAELAGGFGLPTALSLSDSIEETFRRRLEALPEQSQQLLFLAAADTVGDPVLVWRAAERLGIRTPAATPAVSAGLIQFATRVRFRHPLVRSAAYRAATLEERQAVHRALAEVTDPSLDPDRRAWHLAKAAPGPDEAVADELERSAGRAQSRGGLAASAAFLERSAELTLDPARRGRRLLAAARANRDAGALEAALRLLDAIEAGPIEELMKAAVEHLRGQVALVQHRGSEASRLLLSAAKRLEPLNADLARETYLEALEQKSAMTFLLEAAWFTRDIASSSGAGPAPEASRPPGSAPRPVDLLLKGFSTRLTEGYAAAAPTLTQALKLVLDSSVTDLGRWLWLAGARNAGMVALELWDADSAHVLGKRQVDFARETGALLHLQFALNFLAINHLLAGELSTAALMTEEERLIGDATGNPAVAYTELMVAGWRGHEPQASNLIDAALQKARARGLRRMVVFAGYANSVLYNGLGRHDAAREAAWQAFERDQVGYGPLILPELVEAAARTGDVAVLKAATEWMIERTRTTRSDWALGIEARIKALLSEGQTAEDFYQQSIDRLCNTRVRAELARTHLLYGEWLRRERRRIDARVQLRTAHELFARMGAEAFADRAARELRATGGTVRKRTVETSENLTPQERQIAQLAMAGLSNPEIGTRLFISPRTVQYHLHKVFTKLHITSRSQLDRVLAGDLAT